MDAQNENEKNELLIRLEMSVGVNEEEYVKVEEEIKKKRVITPKKNEKAKKLCDELFPIIERIKEKNKKRMTYRESILLPINRINGIVCNCEFIVVPSGLHFSVELPNKYDMKIEEHFTLYIKYFKNINENYSMYYKSDELYVFCDELLKIIPELRLDINGKLVEYIDNRSGLISCIYEVFEDIDNIVLDKKLIECCVCHENTRTQLPCCNGNLCHRCWSNIAYKTDEECAEISVVPCPLCRADISIIDDDA